jgi:outer membrane protein assembly factor BamD
MTKKIILPGFLSLVLVVGLSGCGWFSSEKPDAPPEVLAQEGIKDLKKRNYLDAIDTFEKLKDRYPYSDHAIMAQLKVADAYFYNKKYEEAVQAYREFEKLHPTNKAVPYCIYREGLCYYRQRSTIDRDQTYTHRAIAEFQRLKQKFPKSRYMAKANVYMAKCRQDLAEHELYVADFYYKTKRYQAAIDRYQGLIQDYPDFPENAEAKERIKECERLLAAEKKPKGVFSSLTSIFDARW